MASLGLKLFYLRTREKKLSQRDVAKALDVRQATVSNLEQEVTAPHWSLLVQLCKFYDVTPTYFADEERGVIPAPTERWGLRNSLLTMGMWVEVSSGAIEEIGKDSKLCLLEPGSAFFDAEAVDVRRRYKRAGNSRGALDELREKQTEEERHLEKDLRNELKLHPRRRKPPSE